MSRCPTSRGDVPFDRIVTDAQFAVNLSDRRARLTAQAGPNDLFSMSTPSRTKFVATYFRGSNVVEGPLVGQGRNSVFECPAFRLAVQNLPSQPSHPPAVAIRGEDLRNNTRPNPEDIAFDAVLERAVYRGVSTDYQLKLADGQVVNASATSGQDQPAGQKV
jgi:ABC-type Fe3+/spermidine/putrescine transport system ATPase subunit